MKQSPQEQEQNRRLSPSKFSRDGFLGSDTRSLEEIVSSDRRTLEGRGLTVEAVAKGLRDIFARAKAGLGDEVDLGGGAAAAYHEARGRVPSPFSGDGTFEKGTVTVTLPGEAQPFILTDLSIFLIGKYGFFQGTGSPFRIEPLAAAKLLGKG